MANRRRIRMSCPRSGRLADPLAPPLPRRLQPPGRPAVRTSSEQDPWRIVAVTRTHRTGRQCADARSTDPRHTSRSCQRARRRRNGLTTWPAPSGVPLGVAWSVLPHEGDEAPGLLREQAPVEPREPQSLRQAGEAAPDLDRVAESGARVGGRHLERVRDEETARLDLEDVSRSGTIRTTLTG